MMCGSLLWLKTLCRLHGTLCESCAATAQQGEMFRFP